MNPKQLPANDLITKLRTTFDELWYYSTYELTIDRLRLPREHLFEFYLRCGGRLGHDPNPRFSEILYRLRNADVYEYLLLRQDYFGYMHFVEYGSFETDRLLATEAESSLTRKICAQLDPEFLSKTYAIDGTKYISPFDFYFLNVREGRLSPSPLFSEEGYRRSHPDIDEAIKSGAIASGFAHFILTLHSERRSYSTVSDYETIRRQEELQHKKTILESSLPSITYLYSFDLLSNIDFHTKDVKIHMDKSDHAGMVALVPNYLPEILFAGYLAFFDFLQALKADRGLDLRLIVVSQIPDEHHKHNLMRMKLHGDRNANIFSSVVKLGPDRVLHIPNGYRPISYCADTHYVADMIGRRLGVLPIFFIQDYEPDFHPEGDAAVYSRNAFELPHFGIYNSSMLCKYFLTEGEMLARHGQKYRYCCFENYVEPIAVGREEFVRRHSRKKGKRLIFYGRPEQHAARNHFVMFLLGLRTAVKQLDFDPEEWEFLSIGSLVFEGEIPVDGDYKLRCLTKLPKAEYAELLQTGDIGVSFISTPHPGVVHFQMASFGLVTITNVTKMRTAEWLYSVNNNIIAVELSPSAIAKGLGAAVARCGDLDGRYENARKARHLSKEQCLRPAIDAVIAELDSSAHARPEKGGR